MRALLPLLRSRPGYQPRVRLASPSRCAISYHHGSQPEGTWGIQNKRCAPICSHYLPSPCLDALNAHLAMCQQRKPRGRVDGIVPETTSTILLVSVIRFWAPRLFAGFQGKPLVVTRGALSDGFHPLWS